MTMTLYKRGSRGEMVRQIQKALHLLADGIFGSQTEEAVRLAGSWRDNLRDVRCKM